MNVSESRDSFLRTVAQITAERVAAQPVVETLRDGSNVWDRDIPSSWRTAGFVQELTSKASAILESNPRESLSLAQLALAVATSIPAGTYATPVQAQLEGSAWKEIGTAHRYLSEYDAALRAYDAAHRAFATANALAHDDAVVDFARAIVFVDLGKHDEALGLLAKVGPLFESFDDHRHLVQSKVLAASIRYQQGQLQAARDLYEQALSEIEFSDPHTRAITYNNLGQVCSDLGDTNTAVQMLHKAREILSDMGMTGEVTRAEWALANVVMKAGDFGKALLMLEKVRDTFLSLSMPEEAGLAGLDLADALIANSRSNEARQVVEVVIGEFTRANLNRRAITALAYLRDVLPTTSRPQRTVQHVRKYLEQLRSEPARLFLPLPEEEV
jgi:tetratricopeptide (TPR) repeat protein